MNRNREWRNKEREEERIKEIVVEKVPIKYVKDWKNRRK